MATAYARIRLILAAIGLLLVVAAPVAAQQPTSVNPTASAVKEQQLLQQNYRIQGLGSIPDVKSYVIEQPMGRTWRLFHEVWLHWFGAIIILGASAILLVFYLVRGVIRIDGGRSGRMMPRFGSFERIMHWTTAVSFVILGITGLNITFGKDLLLPLIGPDAFSRWSILAKYAHNYSSFPFVLGMIALFVLWLKEAIFTAVDVRWFMEGGGMIGHKHPAAWKLNGGQKVQFWGATLGTIGVASSGLFLLFPFYFTDIYGMQIAQMVHALIAMLFVGLIIAHIYIGSLGMEGGFEGMASGEVDLNWAKQHHSLWVEQELGQGRSAAPPTGATTRPAS